MNRDASKLAPKGFFARQKMGAKWPKPPRIACKHEDINGFCDIGKGKSCPPHQKTRCWAHTATSRMLCEYYKPARVDIGIVKCSECIFYNKKYDKPDVENGSSVGYCVKNAPTINGWPEVLGDLDFCGEGVRRES